MLITQPSLAEGVADHMTAHHFHFIRPSSNNVGVTVTDCIDSAARFASSDYRFWEIQVAKLILLKKEVRASRMLGRLRVLGEDSGRQKAGADDDEVVKAHSLEYEYSDSEDDSEDEDA